MEVEGAMPMDTRFNGQRRIRQPWNPLSGFEQELPEHIWPEELVSRDDHGHVWVDFNRWVSLGDRMPDITYPGQKKPNVPFPWTDPQINQFMQQPNPKLLVDDEVLQVMMPIPVYTPLLFLMLNGTRVGGKKLYKYNGVVSVEEVIKCYSWARLFAQRPVPPNDPAYDMISSAKTQFRASILSIETRVKDHIQKIPDFGPYMLRMQSRINEMGLKALEQDDEDRQMLTRLADAYVTEMFLKIKAHEVMLVRLLCPNFKKFEDINRFHIGTGLPTTNPKVPGELLAPLYTTLMETAIQVLKLRATAAKCMFIVPETLVLEPRVHGIPAHFLRIVAAMALFAPEKEH